MINDDAVTSLCAALALGTGFLCSYFSREQTSHASRLTNRLDGSRKERELPGRGAQFTPKNLCTTHRSWVRTIGP